MYLRRDLIVRLACMKHAASVRPEPGSNSPLSEKFILSLYLYRVWLITIFVVLIIRFWINKFFQYRFHNIVSFLFCCQCANRPELPWISQLKLLRFFFFAIYYFNFGFNSSALSWLLPSSLTCLRGLQTGGFLSELFYLIASSFIVNYIFYISLHVC